MATRASYPLDPTLLPSRVYNSKIIIDKHISSAGSAFSRRGAATNEPFCVPPDTLALVHSCRRVDQGQLGTPRYNS